MGQDTRCAKRILSLLASFLLVAYAQPDFSVWACMASACIGYALCWYSLEGLSAKRKFTIAFVWMMGIQLIHMSWLTSWTYTGPGILLGWVVHTASVGLIFGVLSVGIGRLPAIGVASLWVLLEWLRPWLYFGIGFSWNPLGLALTAHPWSLQCASIAGVLGLGFWVILTNALIYHKRRLGWILAVLPYALGGVLYVVHRSGEQQAPQIHALLVQLAHPPHQCDEEIWQTLLAVTAPYVHNQYDVIVFPEGGVPHAAQQRYIPVDGMRELMQAAWGESVISSDIEGILNNEEMGDLLTQAMHSPLVMGMTDVRDGRAYNAAFSFSPHAPMEYYHKRQLLAFGEYLPFCFRWVRFLLPIDLDFSAGESAICLGKTLPFGVAICYEETVGNINRRARQQGARYLLGLTNDVWYPQSRLPLSHLHHARVRTVELGIPMLRACNTGVTCAINSVGEVVASLPYERRGVPPCAGALDVQLPLHRYATPYLLWGDLGILIFASGVILSLLLKKTTLVTVPVFHGNKLT